MGRSGEGARGVVGSTRPGLVVPVRTDPTGATGPTPKQARGASWRRTSRGLYVPAEVDHDLVEQRIIEAAAVLPSFGAVTGWAALRWCGAGWFGGLYGDGATRRPVTLVTSCSDIREQPGISVSAEQLGPEDIIIVDGVRVTTPERSALFEMRYARYVEAAVVVADMVMHDDLASPGELAAYASRLKTWTGIPLAREALALARENSWSPQETRMRLLWTRVAGLPEPRCNLPVFDLHGHHVGTPDLIDPVAGVVGEYEGVVHLERGQRGRDVRREHAFRDVGLEYFAMVAADWRDDTAVAARMRSAYRRACSAPAVRRRWTVQPPAWWKRTDTVAARRSLSRTDRLRLLSHRAS